MGRAALEEPDLFRQRPGAAEGEPAPFRELGVSEQCVAGLGGLETASSGVTGIGGRGRTR